MTSTTPRRQPLEVTTMSPSAWSQDSMEFAASGTRVPWKVLRLMKKNGAVVTRKFGLTLVEINNAEAQGVLDALSEV